MDLAAIMTALASPEGQADPYPLYSALHGHGEAAQLAPGRVLAAGYDAVNEVLRDPSFTVSDAAALDRDFAGWREHPSLEDFSRSILNTNSPDHPRMRSVMVRAFTPRRVASLKPAIAGLTDTLLDAMAARGAAGEPVEFMHDFAFLLPVTVICELLGIAEADRESFRPLARDLTATFEPVDPSILAAADAAAIAVREYFTGLCADRRARPRDDLVSALVEVSDADSARLSRDELLANLMLLLVAGFETTTNLLGNGLRIVLGDPSLQRGLAGGSVPAGQFVAEVLRYDSPVQLTSRQATVATEVGGVTAAPGAEVITVLGAANRDPRRFGARMNSARTGMTPPRRTTRRSALAPAPISASAPPRPSSRAPSRSRGCWRGFPRWPRRVTRSGGPDCSCAGTKRSRSGWRSPPEGVAGERQGAGSSLGSQPPEMSSRSTASTDCCRDIAEVSIVSSASVGSS